MCINQPGTLIPRVQSQSSHPKHSGRQNQSLHSPFQTSLMLQDYLCTIAGLSWRKTPAPSISVCSWKWIQQDYKFYWNCSVTPLLNLGLTAIPPSDLRLFSTYIIYLSTFTPKCPIKPTHGQYKCWFCPAFFSCCFPKTSEGKESWWRE